MDHSRPRPLLPGSTPAPPPSGKASVYQTTAVPHFDPKPFIPQDAYATDVHGSISSTMAATQYRKSQERAISKIVNKLPYQLRESVSSIVNMTLSASEIAQKNLEISHHELIDLRNELNRKNIELETAQKTCGIYREKLRGQHESMDTLKDDLDTKAKHALRNQKYLARLSSTNKMLIGSLNALNVEPPSPAMKAADKRSRPIMLRPMSYNDQPESGNEAVAAQAGELGASHPNLLQVISKPSSPADSNQYPQAATTVGAPNTFANEKLRASLLRVAREHYLSQKLSQSLERKIDELRHTLREAEAKNRLLVNELSELRSVHSDETGALGGAGSSTNAVRELGAGSIVKVRSYGKIDDRFKACIKRDTLSPESGLLATRRILEFMSYAPITMDMSEIAQFIVNKDANKIFGTEIMCLTLKNKSNDSSKLPQFGVPLSIPVSRHSSREDRPDSLVIVQKAKGQGKCLVFDCMTLGHPTRSNNLNRVGAFDPAVDVCSGVVASRIMCIPLRDCTSSSGATIGAIQFINKVGDGFTEADELLGLVFADQASTLLSQCIMAEQANKCMNVYRRILESAVSLYSLIPDPDAITAKAEFGITSGDVLQGLEELTRDALKCRATRAFLVSDAVEGQVDAPSTGRSFLMLNHNAKGKGRSEVMNVSADLGVAGHALSTRCIYEISDSSSDERLNPQVDIEVIGEPVISVPVVDVTGRVFAVIQLTPGPMSPKLELPLNSTNKPEDKILFSQAAQWLAYQLVTPLRYLFFLIGRAAVAPCASPALFAERRVSSFKSSNVNMSLRLLGADISSNNNESNSAVDDTMSDGERSALLSKIEEMAAQLASKDVLVSSLTSAQAQTAEAQLVMEMSLKSTQAVLDNIKEQYVVADAKAAELETQLIVSSQQIAMLSNKVLQAEALAEAAVQSATEDQPSQPVAERSSRDGEELVRLQAQLSAADSQAASNAAVLAARNQECNNLSTQLSDRMKEIEAFQSQLENAASNERKLRGENEALLREKETTSSDIAALNSQLQSVRDELSASVAAVEQKDVVIGILQDQVVKMAEDSFKGSDLAALRESLVASMTAVNPIAGTSRPATVGSAKGSLHSSPPPAGSRPQTSAKAPDLSDAVLQGSSITYPWTELVDDEGNIYYFNQENGETSWTLPDAVGGNGLAQVTHGDWVECYDDQGNLYYLNQVSGESSWELPAGI